MMKSAVLFSGGLDSVVLANMLAHTKDLRALILVNYGQAAYPRQQQLLLHWATVLGCDARVVPFDYSQFFRNPQEPGAPLPGVFEPNFIPADAKSRDQLTTDIGSLSTEPDFCWLDGRNPLFMLMASIVASYLGCSKLFVGTQFNDVELDMNTNVVTGKRRGCDTNIHTINTMNEVVYQSFGQPFIISAPFAWFSKRQIAALGQSMGVDFTQSHSCEYYPPCGVCSQCTDRTDALSGLEC